MNPRRARWRGGNTAPQHRHYPYWYEGTLSTRRRPAGGTSTPARKRSIEPAGAGRQSARCCGARCGRSTRGITGLHLESDCRDRGNQVLYTFRQLRRATPAVRSEDYSKKETSMQLTLRNMAPALMVLTLALAGCKTAPTKNAGDAAATPQTGQQQQQQQSPSATASVVEFYVARTQAGPPDGSHAARRQALHGTATRADARRPDRGRPAGGPRRQQLRRPALRNRARASSTTSAART